MPATRPPIAYEQPSVTRRVRFEEKPVRFIIDNGKIRVDRSRCFRDCRYLTFVRRLRMHHLLARMTHNDRPLHRVPTVREMSHQTWVWRNLRCLAGKPDPRLAQSHGL